MKRYAHAFVILSITVFVTLFSLIIIEVSNYVTASTVSQHLPTIIIDAGHGGFDPGAVAGDGTVEKDINLAIALKLRGFLLASGYNVIMTRETDTGTDYSEFAEIKDRKVADMKNRLKLMNSTDNALFISIHLNKFDSEKAKGAQVFYSPNLDESKLLSDKIQSSILGLLQPENTRVTKKGTKSTFLLYYAECPAVIVECGFLSNPAELELLKNTAYQNKIAFAVACGVFSYFS